MSESRGGIEVRHWQCIVKILQSLCRYSEGLWLRRDRAGFDDIWLMHCGLRVLGRAWIGHLLRSSGGYCAAEKPGWNLSNYKILKTYCSGKFQADTIQNFNDPIFPLKTCGWRTSSWTEKTEKWKKNNSPQIRRKPRRWSLRVNESPRILLAFLRWQTPRQVRWLIDIIRLKRRQFKSGNCCFSFVCTFSLVCTIDRIVFCIFPFLIYSFLKIVYSIFGIPKNIYLNNALYGAYMVRPLAFLQDFNEDAISQQTIHFSEIFLAI